MTRPQQTSAPARDDQRADRSWAPRLAQEARLRQLDELLARRHTPADADAVNRIQQAINSFYGQVYSEAPLEEAEAAPPEGAVTLEDAPPPEEEGLESQASDTIMESPELAAGADTAGHSGAEINKGEISEP